MNETDEVKEIEQIINDKWINIDEAAEYLGIKPVTLRGWIKNNKGVPAHKLANNGSLKYRNWMLG